MASGFCFSVSFLRPVNLCFWHPQGTVLTPTMDHAMSIQPTSMMGPLTQQLSHLSLGNTGTVSSIAPSQSHYVEPLVKKVCVYLQYIPANTAMQGTYIPQFTPVPPSSVPEVRSDQSSPLFFFRPLSLKHPLLGEWWSTAAGNHGDPRRAHKLHIPTHKVNLR